MITVSRERSGISRRHNEKRSRKNSRFSRDSTSFFLLVIPVVNVDIVHPVARVIVDLSASLVFLRASRYDVPTGTGRFSESTAAFRWTRMHEESNGNE